MAATIPEPVQPPASKVDIHLGASRSTEFQILVDVVTGKKIHILYYNKTTVELLHSTDPPSCGCGFMSVERMGYNINVDTLSHLINPDERQQISPEMRFTCDGMITNGSLELTVLWKVICILNFKYGEIVKMKHTEKSTAH